MRAQVVVAGHVCLDIIPIFDEQKGNPAALFQPGKLVNIAATVTAPGGAVSNTGLALHRLGIPVKLLGKVGGDIFGRELLNIFRSYDKSLAESMIVTESVASSYTIVISHPGVDRSFLYYPGPNDAFVAGDVDLSEVAGARIFHFGYPPIMRRVYLDGGVEFALLLQRIKAAGLTTSLDMTIPDANSEAGTLDWAAFMQRVLPFVDLFLPSIEELLLMLDRPRFDALNKRGDLLRQIDATMLTQLAQRVLDMGVAIVAIKLGDQGLYVRTTADAARLAAMGAMAPQTTSGWLGRELLSPCFQVDVVGTTGAGDCAIAGFLAGFLKGLPLMDVIIGATAVGAFNVESPDATSGIPDWETVQARIQAGWEKRTPTISLNGWLQQQQGAWIGPEEQKTF